ncbi:hypothetical protein [Agrobacterium rosae]|uniref:hypothetical protein n=1 Tax=Agrobacterium rosae TaxID=1972867 RepID=UPI00387B1913
MAEHIDIAAAIIAGKSDEAERAMRDHVIGSGNTYLSTVFNKREEIRWIHQWKRFAAR